MIMFGYKFRKFHLIFAEIEINHFPDIRRGVLVDLNPNYTTKS